LRGNQTKSSVDGFAGNATYVFPFEKLDVYKMSLDLADDVLGLLGRLPQNRHIRLISQVPQLECPAARRKKGVLE